MELHNELTLALLGEIFNCQLWNLYFLILNQIMNYAVELDGPRISGENITFLVVSAVSKSKAT